MTSTESSRPALLSATRRWGRCENFHRFDHLSSGQASLGTKCMGKMLVDCKFLFKKSRWGVLSEERFPAGIIYLDLNFGPPQDCRLETVTVTVTLDDDDECLNMYKAKPGRKYHKSACPVQMTDCYGPKQLVGEQKNTEFKRTMYVAPEINVFGTGIGGVGIDSEKTFKYSSRWNFNGQILPDKGSWAYKTLKFELSENELEKQTFRSNCVHTAFAFEHSGQPFLMKVEIEGKLAKWNHRIKSRLKFGSRKRTEDQATTLMDFEKFDLFRDRLDGLAKSLPRAMELENYEAIPVEIPDVAPVSFQPALSGVQLSQLTASSANDQMKLEDNIALQQEKLPQTADPSLLRAPKVPQLLCDQQDPATLDLAEPNLENLRRAVRILSKPLEQDIIRPSELDSFSVSSRTEVATEEEREEKAPIHNDAKAELAPATAEMDHEAVLKLVQVPAVLTILQFLARLMDMLGTLEKRRR